MSNENRRSVIGGFIFGMLLVVFTVGYLIGVFQGSASVERDAIKHKVGTYVADENGNSKFEWIKLP